jgi:hypothetical protein
MLPSLLFIKGIGIILDLLPICEITSFGFFILEKKA